MLAKFILTIVILTSDGALDTASFGVTACPDLADFTSFMDDKKKAGEFIGWDATCVSTKIKVDESI